MFDPLTGTDKTFQPQYNQGYQGYARNISLIFALKKRRRRRRRRKKKQKKQVTVLLFASSWNISWIYPTLVSLFRHNRLRYNVTHSFALLVFIHTCPVVHVECCGIFSANRLVPCFKSIIIIFPLMRNSQTFIHARPSVKTNIRPKANSFSIAEKALTTPFRVLYICLLIKQSSFLVNNFISYPFGNKLTPTSLLSDWEISWLLAWLGPGCEKFCSACRFPCSVCR